MADGGAVLKFPVGKQEAPVSRPRQAPPPPAMDSYGQEEAMELHQIASSVKRKAEDLVKFVDDNRAVARQAGIEVIAVQINSILEGDRFQRVMDALEDAAYRAIPLGLTREGVDKVHRLEKLVADADGIIVGFMNGKRDYAIGQSQPLTLPYVEPRRSSEASDWMPAIIFGIAGLVGLVVILAITQKSRTS